MDTAETTKVTPRSGTHGDREAILARGRAVLEAEAAAIGDALGRMGDAFVGAVEAIRAGRVVGVVSWGRQSGRVDVWTRLTGWVRMWGPP